MQLWMKLGEGPRLIHSSGSSVPQQPLGVISHKPQPRTGWSSNTLYTLHFVFPALLPSEFPCNELPLRTYFLMSKMESLMSTGTSDKKNKDEVRRIVPILRLPYNECETQRKLLTVSQPECYLSYDVNLARHKGKQDKIMQLSLTSPTLTQ